ncbi:AbiTii domain-containing protein [Vibrio diabolicus]|uniref:AbiTii domain-containing protein n=1 Tax=Vibrio diabolicus TaxID=50719 RepID=UPI0021601E54|nr:hypothetical protein [Vibrio diabolicus]MCS0314471.1 hypothetical protein [Vibrio diabolicus]
MNNEIKSLIIKCNNPNYPLSYILREAILISNKVNDQKFSLWATLEKEGYQNNIENIPEYRIFNLPIIATSTLLAPEVIHPLANDEYMKKITSFQLTWKVNEIESFLESNHYESYSSFNHVKNHEIHEHLHQSIGLRKDVQFIFKLKLTKSNLYNTLESIRDKVLDWLIKLI